MVSAVAVALGDWLVIAGVAILVGTLLYQLVAEGLTRDVLVWLLFTGAAGLFALTAAFIGTDAPGSAAAIAAGWLLLVGALVLQFRGPLRDVLIGRTA